MGQSQTNKTPSYLKTKTKTKNELETAARNDRTGRSPAMGSCFLLHLPPGSCWLMGLLSALGCFWKNILKYKVFEIESKVWGVGEWLTFRWFGICTPVFPGLGFLCARGPSSGGLLQFFQIGCAGGISRPHTVTPSNAVLRERHRGPLAKETKIGQYFAQSLRRKAERK